jgi:glycerol kinase
MNKILAIDQGTTSTKSLVLDADGQILGSSWPAHFGVAPTHPRSGWVEYDPRSLLESVCHSARAAIQNSGVHAADIAAIGLANQGETVIAFDTLDGQPIHPAISWQDRRGQPFVDQWRASGLDDEIFQITGLRLDAYFSAPKLAWILQNVPQARKLQAAGRLGLGTSDAWLVWQLTGGQRFVTDVATASRTMVLNLETLRWDPRLLEAFQIRSASLPTIVQNAEPVGTSTRQLLDAEISIAGLCVDQQAALFGHCSFEAGHAKITYGTGCFVLANIGECPSRRSPGLLTSVGWQVSGKTSFVVDGGVYSAGSLVDWLCALGLAADANELARLAYEAGEPSATMLVPAFGGMGAPRWAAHARACWLGMDSATDRRQLARSAFDAIAFRVKEIAESLGDAGIPLEHVVVDGGLSRCDVLMQIQADILGIPLVRSELTEFTALGAGYLAGLGCGLWKGPLSLPRPGASERIFQPSQLGREHLLRCYTRWLDACSRIVEMGDAGVFHTGGS